MITFETSLVESGGNQTNIRQRCLAYWAIRSITLDYGRTRERYVFGLHLEYVYDYVCVYFRRPTTHGPAHNVL